jgi:hypothetical protein
MSRISLASDLLVLKFLTWGRGDVYGWACCYVLVYLNFAEQSNI